MSRITKNRAMITPGDLCTANIVAGYRNEIKAATLVKLDVCWHQMAGEVVSFIAETGADELSVLQSTFTGFPAWFRVLYPERLNDQIFDTWGDAAYDDFLRNAKLRDFARATANKVFVKCEERWGGFVDSDTSAWGSRKR